MAEFDISSDAGNTYNLATRGFMYAAIQGHNHDSAAHKDLFSKVNARLNKLETETVVPEAIEKRDKNGDVLCRINADLSVYKDGEIKTLLTSDHEGLDIQQIWENKENIEKLQRDLHDTGEYLYAAIAATSAETNRRVDEAVHVLDDKLDHYENDVEVRLNRMDAKIDECGAESRAYTDAECEAVKEWARQEGYAGKEYIDNNIAVVNNKLQTKFAAATAYADDRVQSVEGRTALLESGFRAYRERIDSRVERCESICDTNNEIVNELVPRVSYCEGMTEALSGIIHHHGHRLDNAEYSIRANAEAIARLSEQHSEDISALKSDIESLETSSGTFSGEIAAIWSELANTESSVEQQIGELSSAIANEAEARTQAISAAVAAEAAERAAAVNGALSTVRNEYLPQVGSFNEPL